MKASNFILIGGALAVAFACDNREDRLEARQEALEDFVDSVETAVNRHDSHDWIVLDTRYNSLVRDLEMAELHLSEDEGGKREELDRRYAEAKANDESKTMDADVEAQAEVHLENVETWWERTKDNVEEGAENTMEDIEEATQESMAWLEQNFEKLGDDVQERYRRVKVEIEG